MKYIIFVTTFASICGRVLPLIEEKKDKGEIVIVATTDQLENFFRKNTDFKVIRTKVHPDLIDQKTKHKIFYNIILSKIEFNNLFKDLKNAEIYFSNRACAVVIFSYIKKLKKRNTVYFFGNNTNKNAMEFPVENGLRAFIMRLIVRWGLGIETYVRTRAGVPFWTLDERYFKVIQKIKSPTESKDINRKYSNRLDILNGKNILIAYNDSISCGFVEENEFINNINRLMEILNTIAPDKYTIKAHPRLNKFYGKMSEVTDVIPSYIPLQLVLGHDWKMIIGFDSGSLISSAEQTNADVISLMDCLRYNDQYLKKKFRDNLVNNSQNRIKFLENIEELKDIIE